MALVGTFDSFIEDIYATLGFFFLGKLCQDDGTEHDDASEDFPGTQALTEDNPSGKDGDAGFQAQNQGGHGRIHILLTDNL